ncbi:MAG: tetratricopeptide repeat protein [Burkholderiaceae bacterium]|nr:tetratricopeptide repeat protein [Burkholderiaceae bacterium]
MRFGDAKPVGLTGLASPFPAARGRRHPVVAVFGYRAAETSQQFEVVRPAAVLFRRAVTGGRRPCSQKRPRLSGQAGATFAAVLCVLIAGCASSPQKAAPAPAATSAASTKAPASQTQSGAAAARAKETPSGISPDVQRQFESGLDALNAGHADDAARVFLALTKSHADLAGPHANLGLIYRQSGKRAESVAELEQAVRLDPQQPVFLNQLGISYRQLGQFTKAREAYQKAIALDPSYPAAYLNLGILFDLYFWDSKRALEFYDRYLALTPGGDDKVVKWVADIKNRSQQSGNKVSRQEQP